MECSDKTRDGVIRNRPLAAFRGGATAIILGERP
jgi:hypothetical protein